MRIEAPARWSNWFETSPRRQARFRRDSTGAIRHSRDCKIENVDPRPTAFGFGRSKKKGGQKKPTAPKREPTTYFDCDFYQDFIRRVFRYLLRLVKKKKRRKNLYRDPSINISVPLLSMQILQNSFPCARSVGTIFQYSSFYFAM